MTKATTQPALPLAGLRPSLKSRFAERVARSRDPVARLRSGAALELYYEAGDAHSQLCAALARRLLPRLKLPLQIRLVPAADASAYPEEARQRAFAAEDAARLALCHGLPPPVTLGPGHKQQLEQVLAASRSTEEFLAAEAAALQAPQAINGGASLVDTQALLQANAARRRQLNHYLPAMWQYRGEWFWALDRLDFLEQRLRERNALEGATPLSALDPAQLQLPAPAPDTPLEFWFSFRSPYSYLAAVELLRRRTLHHRLQVRPVLPMVMRGLPVPAAKRLYIVRDVQRCADALGVPFGRIHDPVGEGALRLLTVFPYSVGVETQLRYAAIAGQSVWAEGLDARRDEVLRSIFARSGLDWEPARRKLADGIDLQQAQANREALFASGLWGVPSFRCGGFTTWGQDRLWMLDRLLAPETPRTGLTRPAS